ncbi:MAG: uroporphyrinogen decarboxylase [Helicobacter sp.]|nr:uroporphyrinogen decarboxylase [Helicobacter sp.]
MIFIDACFGRATSHTPVWFMRQAGRYLAEYRATRARAKDFLGLCKNPELACEVTLQPIDILDVDAAILFSDILVIPLEMGLGLGFYEGKGPHFAQTIRFESDLSRLQPQAFMRTNYVYETLAKTRAKLPQDKALIGFCGAPWTLATYMIEGESSKQFVHSKRMLYANPNMLKKLLAILCEELKNYLSMQASAGANALMIFDSWAGALSPAAYLEFGWQPICEIADFLRAKHPEIPLIVFPKGVGGFLEMLTGNFAVLGIDWGIPMAKARNLVGERFVLQGNLEPATLYDANAMEQGAREILRAMSGQPFIFNLGHGMLPDLPRENAQKLVEIVHKGLA